MIIGFGAKWLFEKTRIPQAIILLLVGFALGPLGLIVHFTLPIIDPKEFQIVTPIVGAIAIISIVFEAGLRLKLKELFGKISFTTIFAIANIIVCVFVLTGILYFLIGWDFLSALLLGSLLGGSSSFAVYSILPLVRTSDHARNILLLEGTLSAVFISIITITIMRYSQLGMQFDLTELVKLLVSSFAVSLILGLFFGLIILWALLNLKIKERSYLLVFSALLVIYFLDFAYLGGIGVISILVIGLLLSNSEEILKFFKQPKMPETEQLRVFHSEINLFITTFFFVYLGLISRPDHFTYQNFIISLLLMAGIMVSRFAVISASRMLGKSQQHDDILLGFTIPRGLLNATLATFIFVYQTPISFDMEIILLVILMSTIVTSLGVGYYEKLCKNIFLFKKELTLKDGRKVTVRSFTKDDFEKVRRFLNEMVKEEALIAIDERISPDKEKEMGTESIIKMNKGEMIMWVVEHENKIIGRTVAEKMPRRERDNVSLSFYIAKGFRDVGLGTSLLRMITEEALKTFKPQNLYLTVYSANTKAIKLYEREGFEKVGVLPGWMRYGQDYLDRIYMSYKGNQTKENQETPNNK
jgi:cell volume regulation protein A